MIVSLKAHNNYMKWELSSSSPFTDKETETQRNSETHILHPIASEWQRWDLNSVPIKPRVWFVWHCSDMKKVPCLLIESLEI